MKNYFIKFFLFIALIFCTHNIFAQKSWINVSELDQDEQWVFVYEMIERPTESCPYYWITVSWEESSDSAKQDITPRKTIKVFEYTQDLNSVELLNLLTITPKVKESAPKDLMNDFLLLHKARQKKPSQKKLKKSSTNKIII